MPRFNFGSIVVVEKNLIGVVVKSWEYSTLDGWAYRHEVYVRSLNCIKEYEEYDMENYVYNKELDNEQSEYI